MIPHRLGGRRLFVKQPSQFKLRRVTRCNAGIDALRNAKLIDVVDRENEDGNEEWTGFPSFEKWSSDVKLMQR